MSYTEDHLLDDLKRIVVSDVSGMPLQLTHGKLLACIDEIERLRGIVSASLRAMDAAFSRVGTAASGDATTPKMLAPDIAYLYRLRREAQAELRVLSGENEMLRAENGRFRAWLARGVKDAYDSGGSIESPALTGLECQHALDGEDSSK